MWTKLSQLKHEVHQSSPFENFVSFNNWSLCNPYVILHYRYRHTKRQLSRPPIDARLTLHRSNPQNHRVFTHTHTSCLHCRRPKSIIIAVSVSDQQRLLAVWFLAVGNRSQLLHIQTT